MSADVVRASGFGWETFRRSAFLRQYKPVQIPQNTFWDELPSWIGLVALAGLVVYLCVR